MRRYGSLININPSDLIQFYRARPSIENWKKNAVLKVFHYSQVFNNNEFNEVLRISRIFSYLLLL